MTVNYTSCALTRSGSRSADWDLSCGPAVTVSWITTDGEENLLTAEFFTYGKTILIQLWIVKSLGMEW